MNRFMLVLFICVSVKAELQAQEMTGLRLEKIAGKDSLLPVPEKLKMKWQQVKEKTGQPLRLLLNGDQREQAVQMARWIAAKQQKNLCIVNLKEWLDKYIGETEKNLSALFDKAAASGAVLFFDEADALFGKVKATDEKRSSLLHTFDDKTLSYRFLVLVACKEKLCADRFGQQGFETFTQD
jgi:SpoVK/Ycf46/Vps4 family AAA+-type ATPase